MNVEVIFLSDIKNKQAVAKMISEDCLFATKQASNISLKALGAQIERIETIEGVQKIYIKSVDNLLLG